MNSTKSPARDDSVTAQRNGETQQECFVCGKRIADNWFCRIPRDGSSSIVLCSPSCALRHFDAPDPTANNGELKKQAARSGLESSRSTAN